MAAENLTFPPYRFNGWTGHTDGYSELIWVATLLLKSGIDNLLSLDYTIQIHLTALNKLVKVVLLLST